MRGCGITPHDTTIFLLPESSFAASGLVPASDCPECNRGGWPLPWPGSQIQKNAVAPLPYRHEQAARSPLRKGGVNSLEVRVLNASRWLDSLGMVAMIASAMYKHGVLVSVGERTV